MDRHIEHISTDRPSSGIKYPLLETKLRPPKLPGAHVRRNRLLEELATGVTHRALTLLSATAGSGKSVLAASWVEAIPAYRPIAWLGLDVSDDRPGTFWAYTLDALVRQGVTLPHLGRPGQHMEDPSQPFLSWLAADLLAQPQPVVLILDDADRLTSPTVLSGLDFLLAHAAPNFRVVMCCRVDPALPLHRYRLNESMAEIRGAALAFTEQEAEQLLNGHGVQMSTELTSALTRRTGGWAVGLRMAAMALERSADRGALVSSFLATDTTTAEYLVTEILDVQRPELRETLLQTSVASHLWPGLVDELMGRGGGMQALAAFDRANVFLEDGTETTGGRRVHPLLREILQARLAYESPELVPELHRRCAGWLAAAGQLQAAVDHAIIAEDFPYAAALVIDGLAVGSILLPSDVDRYNARMQLLPDSASDANVALVHAALRLASDNPAASLRHLTRADELHESVGTSVQFEFTAAVLRAVLCVKTVDIEGAIGATDEAARLITLLPADQLTAHPELHALLLTSRGTAQLWRGNAEAAERTLTEALAVSTACAAISLRLQCTGRLAMLHALRGELRLAHEFGRAAHELADEAGLGPRDEPVAAAIALAWAYAQQYRDERSRHWLARAEESIADSDRRLLTPVVEILRARLSSQSAAGALELLTSFDARSISLPWIRECFVAEIADLSVAQRRPHVARQVIAGLPEPHSPRMTTALNRLPGEADGLFLQVPAEQLHDGHAALDMRVGAWLAQGRFHLDQDQDQEAVKAIEHALRLAESEQLRRPFIECTPRMREVVRSDIAEHATAWLRGPRSFAPTGARFTPAHPTTTHSTKARSIVQQSLTPRELEVLRHLAELLSTNEIGVTMFVSVNTVRTHVRSILRKLDVSGRNEAVRRAWEMSLI